MNRISIYIEDKVEEARLSGVSPGKLGLTSSVLKKLSDEFRVKARISMGDDKDAKVSKFLNLDVVEVEDAEAPADGVLIYDLKGLK